MKRLLSAVFAIALPHALTAAAGQWTPIGPYAAAGGDVRALAVAPNGDVYAGTTSGASASRDGGVSWESPPELDRETVSAFGFDPTSPLLVYAGTNPGVFRSVDGGRSWSPSRQGLDAGVVTSIAVDPNLPANVYALVLPAGLFRSTDSGMSWSRVATAPFPIVQWGVAIARTQPSTVYLQTPAGLYHSRDGGQSWTLSLTEPMSQVGALAVDPETPTTVLAGGIGSVFRTTDGGLSWVRFRVGSSEVSSIDALAISGDAAGTFFATSANQLFSSANGGANWSRVRDVPAEIQLGLVAADPRSAYIYAASALGGIARSLDSGRTWVTASAFRSFIVAALALAPGVPTRLFAVGEQGVFWTENEGSLWSRAAGSPSVPASSIAVGNGSMYVGTRGEGVFRSLDGGLHWEPTATSIDPQVVSLAVGFGGRLYAGTETGLFRSDDRGAVWRRLTGLPAGTAISSLAADRLAPGWLYAVAGGELFRSFDRGESWTLVRSTPSFPVSALAVAPATPSLVYAGETYSGPGFLGSPIPGGIFRSADGGFTWAEVDAGLPDQGVTALAVDPSDPPVVYASLLNYPAPGGVFRSFDSGTTWQLIGDGLHDRHVTALVADGRSPGRVFAGTYGNSVYEFASAMEPCESGPRALCLSGGRFRVEVAWRSTNVGGGGAGRIMPLTTDTGAFWFFQPSNIELVVKVLDGRSINGKFWVFYGALSNVEYTITVTDTVSGAVKTYLNPEGNLASIADTDAF